MSTTAVRSPAEFEEQLQRYLYERSEEGRAVRVGEKEVSEQAAIVARYADLFSREQLRALRDEEERADGDAREWLYRLRKTCESGLVAARGSPLPRSPAARRSSIAAAAGDVHLDGDVVGVDAEHGGGADRGEHARMIARALAISSSIPRARTPLARASPPGGGA